MKNYSDPTVWAAFLQEHGYAKGIIPPTKELVDVLKEHSDKEVEHHLHGWAWTNDLEARNKQAGKDVIVTQELLDATT